MRPARFYVCTALALLVSGLAPPLAQAAPVDAGRSTAPAAAPQWLAAANAPAVELLLRQLESARLDGLDPRAFRVRDLQRAVRAAARSERSARQAEAMLSEAFVAYARALRNKAPPAEVIYVDSELRPAAPPARELLAAAAAAPSLPEYIRTMGWMHPYYAPLREALAATRDERARRLLAVNLERARLLPPADFRRYVLVNAAQQRLFMIENGRAVDMMRVVVGKPHQPTPMMAALIRFTSLNPYWNVPSDLAAERVAPNVVKQGVGYLRQKGYQLLSDWSDRPKLLDPASVDWKAVAAGRVEVRLRQLPGPSNSMGDMKFMFPNAQGIYLHDTPSTELFDEASRLFSGGCVRLEAAPRLATWLHGRPLRARGARPEQAVPLAEPVPVFITYLTAVPSGGGRLATYQDIYGRDARRIAELWGGARSAQAAPR